MKLTLDREEAITSAGILVEKSHLTGLKMELHGAEKGVSLLVLCHTGSCLQVNLLLVKS